MNSARSFSRAYLSKKMLDRLRAAVDGFHARDLPGAIRLDGLLVDLVEHRSHQEPGHHQRQPHQSGI